MRISDWSSDVCSSDLIASELRDTQALLGDVLPKWGAARDELARTQVRAPVSGTVVGLGVHTVGGVIAAGQTLMDIVPRHSAVVIEARFSRSEEHTSELQSLMRNSYAVFCLNIKTDKQ